MFEKYWGEKEKPEEKKKGGQDVIYKEPSFVEVVENRIYFYSDIGRDQVLQLNRRLNETANDLIRGGIVQSREPASIYLHISSYGGGIFHGLAGMDTILQCKVPVITIIDGCCASAATFLSVAGKRRLIHRHGFMLIHQLSAVTWGKFRELQDDNVNFNKLMETIKKVYTEYTKVPEEKINEILDHDLWFDAETCIKYGLVDEIILG